MATGSTQGNPSQGSLEDIKFGAVRQLPDGSFVEMHSSAGAVWNHKNLSASGTTTVKTGAGQLYGFFCGTATGNITIYNNTAASGDKILDTCALVAGLNPIPCTFDTGLTIVLSGAGVATALYL